MFYFADELATSSTSNDSPSFRNPCKCLLETIQHFDANSYRLNLEPTGDDAVTMSGAIHCTVRHLNAVEATKIVSNSLFLFFFVSFSVTDAVNF